MVDSLEVLDAGVAGARSESVSFEDVMKGEANKNTTAAPGERNRGRTAEVVKNGFPSVLMWDSNSKEAPKTGPSEYGIGGPPVDSKFDINKMPIELTPKGQEQIMPPAETKAGPIGDAGESKTISFGGPFETPAEKAQRLSSENIEHQQKFDGQKSLKVESPQKAPKPEPVVEPPTPKVEAPRPIEPKISMPEAVIERQLPKTPEELLAGIKVSLEEGKLKAFEQIQKSVAEFAERNGMKIPGPGKVVALIIAGGIFCGGAPGAWGEEKGSSGKGTAPGESTLDKFEKAQPYLKGALDIGAFLPPTAAACIAAGVVEAVADSSFAQFSGKNGAELKERMENQRDLSCLAWILDHEHTPIPINEQGQRMGVGEIKAHAMQAANEVMTKAIAEARRGLPPDCHTKEEIALLYQRDQLTKFLHNAGTVRR